MTFVDNALTLPEWSQDLNGQGIVVTDTDLIIRHWSRWLENRSGLRVDAVLGLHLFDVFPDLLTRHLDRLYMQALAGQITVLAQRLHRYLLPLPSVDTTFERMQQSARIGPLLEAGRVVGTVTVVEDVTERVSREHELSRLLAQERTARAAAEATQQRLALLADASALLGASFKDTSVLPQVARVLLPQLGDYCLIDLLDADQIHHAASVHIDPAQEAVLRELVQRYPRSSGVIGVRSGVVEWVRDTTAPNQRSYTQDAAHQRLLDLLATRSMLAVPLVAREQTIGSLTLASSEVDYYRDEDRELVEDLAHRIALAVDNVRLYRATQEALGERDRAFAIAETERAKLQRLFTQAPAAICILQGPQHLYTFANVLYHQIHGNQIVLGKPMREVLPELAGQGVFELLDQVYATGEPAVGEERSMFLLHDNVLEERFFDFAFQSTRDTDGTIDGVLIHKVDVTDRVQARRERESLEEAVRTQREHLRVTLASIGDAVIVTDTRDRITFINRVAESLTGWSEGEALGQPLATIFAVRNDDALLTHVQPLADDQRVFSAQRIFTLQARDGTLVPVESSASLVRDDDNQTTGTVLVFRDVSERRRIENERAELLAHTDAARAEAEAAVRTRDMFFSVAAHELKTPLTSLLGTTQLIQRRMMRDAGLQEREQRSFEVVIKQGNRLQRMIDALLDITRLENDQLSLTQEPLGFDTLVQRVVEEVQPTLTNHTIDFHPPTHPLMVNGDALRLEQVFQNLIQNAVKYSPDGGTVTITVVQRGSFVCMDVTDQGIGIPAQALPLLFQRFFRAANVSGSRQINGLGIGLFVVKEIITLHGGTVTVASEENVGSTFTVSLPLLEHP